MPTITRRIQRAGQRVQASIQDTLQAFQGNRGSRNTYGTSPAYSGQPIREDRSERALIDTNVDSELRPSERGEDPQPQEEAEIRVVDLLETRLKDAMEQRDYLTRQWVLNIAYTRKHFYLGWGKDGKLVSRQAANDPYRTYSRQDKTTPLLAKRIARDIESKPEVGAKPLSSSNIDRQAADEYRAMFSHVDRIHDHQGQMTLLAYWRHVCGQGYLKQYWDPNKEAPIPVAFDAEGNVASVEYAPVGDVCREIVNPLYVFYDPKADCEEAATWMLTAEVKSLTYVRERYEEYGKWGKNAKLVEGRSIGEGYLLMLSSYLGALSGEVGDKASLSGKELQNQCLVVECFERPSPRFPTGRWMVMAGDRLVRYEALPKRWHKRFPIHALRGAPILGSLYGEALMTGSIPMQDEYNTLWSRFMDRVNVDKPTIIVDKGAQIGVDAFSSPRNFGLVYRTPGREVQYIQPPPPGQYWFMLLQQIEANLQGYWGVHDVSDGSVPAGVSAAAAIELLQQSDRTQQASDNSRMETFLLRLAEGTAAEYEADGHASEPRMMAMADAPGQEAWGQAVTFEGLKHGRCRVVPMMTSGVTRSAVARYEQATQWLAAGVFGGNPAVPPSAIENFLNYLGEAKSDEMVASARRAMEEAEAAAERQAMMEAQAQAGAMPPDMGGPMPEDPMMKAEADSQVAQVKAGADTESKSRLQAEKAELDRETYRAKVETDLQAEQARAGMGLHPGQVTERVAQSRMALEQDREQNRMAVEGARISQQGEQQNRSLGLAERQAAFNERSAGQQFALKREDMAMRDRQSAASLKAQADRAKLQAKKPAPKPVRKTVGKQ